MGAGASEEHSVPLQRQIGFRIEDIDRRQPVPPPDLEIVEVMAPA